jgi:hypothetical protein
MRMHLTPEQVEMVDTDETGHRFYGSCPRGWTFILVRATWLRDGSPLKIVGCWRETPEDWVEPGQDHGGVPAVDEQRRNRN